MARDRPTVLALFSCLTCNGASCVAVEATPTELEACRRLLPGLLDVFQIVHVEPFDDRAALQVLGRIASAHAAASRLEVEPSVVPLVHRLHKRFKPYSAFPGPAANFMRALCDSRSVSKLTKRTISSQDVVDLFIKQTGLPEIFLRDDLLLPLPEVRSRFEVQIIGQPTATQAAARLVTTIKAGLTDPGSSDGCVPSSAVPTGVGKTALAKTLVDFCFNAGQERLVRLDMSEYSGWGAAERLLQNPQGQPAAWIERVRRQPFCVVLFDEIEKAAPEVFDVLLSLLDEGRLTDRFGRVTWFRSAIVIMTSNLGSKTSPASAGFSSSDIPSFESEIAKFFRPEFFNRLDAIITFKPLSRDEVEAITRKELSDLGSREGFASAGIKLTWTDRLVRAVAAEGYDHRLGARRSNALSSASSSLPWRVGKSPTLSFGTSLFTWTWTMQTEVRNSP